MSTHHFYGATRSNSATVEYRAIVEATQSNDDGKWSVRVTAYLAHKDGTRFGADDHFEVARYFDDEKSAVSAGAQAATAWGLRH